MIHFPKSWATRLSISMLLFYLPLLLTAQQFNRHYRSTVATEHVVSGGLATEYRGRTQMRPTSDGGYIWVATVLGSPFGHDIVLTKTTASGDVTWTERFVNSNQEFATDVWPTADGGYIVCGHTGTGTEGQGDGLLIKTNSVGAVQWSKTYGADGDEFFGSMRVLSDGYVIVGTTQSFGPSGCDGAGKCYNVLLIKTNLSGVIQHQQVIADASGKSSWGKDITLVKSGGFLAVGVSTSNHGDAFAIRTNAQLQPTWWKRYPENYGNINQSSIGEAVRAVQGGFIIGGGTTTGFSSSTGEQEDAYMLRLDDDGIPLWAKAYDVVSGQWEHGYDIEKMGVGYAMACTRVIPGNVYNNGFLVRTDLSGNLLWDKNYGNTNSDTKCFSLVRTQDDGLILSGEHLSTTFGGQWRFLALKTNELGTSGCQEGNLNTNVININASFVDIQRILYSGISTGTYTPQQPQFDLLVDTPCLNYCQGEVAVILSGDFFICGSDPATLTATPSGGTSPYTYLWSNGATTSTVSVSTPGTYTVWVEDADNCVGSASVTVAEITPPNVSISANPGLEVCVDEALTLTANHNATGPVSFDWYDQANPGTTLGGNPSFSPPTSTVGTFTYCVEVYVGAGCSTTECITVTVNPLPNIVSLEALYCEGAPADIIGGTGSFFGDGTFSSTPAGAVYPDPLGPFTYWYFDPSAAPGTYTIEYCMNATGCCTTQVVTIVDEPEDINYGEVCESDPCIDLTTIVSEPLTSFSGPGVSGNQFCPGVAGPGIHTINFCFPTPVPCSGCATITIEVVASSSNDWPKLAADPVTNFQNEQGEALIQGPDGSFYVTGTFSGSIEFDDTYQFNALNNGGSGTDLWVVKYGTCGVEWAISASNDLGWLSPTNSVPTDILYADGRLFISANVTTAGNTKGNLLCLNAADGSLNAPFGNKVIGAGYNNETWANRIGYRGPGSTPGMVYVTGAVKGAINFSVLNQVPMGGYNSLLNTKDIFLATYTVTGSEVWMTTQGGKRDDIAHGITVYPNGDAAITGEVFRQAIGQTCTWPMPLSNLNGGNLKEVFVGRYFANGCEHWMVLNGGLGNDVGIDIKLDGNLNLIVMGTFETVGAPTQFGLASTLPLVATAGMEDMFLVRYSTVNGAALTATRVGGNASPGYRIFPHSLHYLGNSNVVFTSGTFRGQLNYGGGLFATNSIFDSDPYVMRFSGSTFTQQWAAQGKTPAIPTPNDRDAGTDVIADVYGNAYLTGGYYNDVDFAPQPTLTAEHLRDYFAVRVSVGGNFYKEALSESPIDPVIGNSLTVYPNPNRGQFTVRLEQAEETPAELRLRDLNGRVVLARQLAAGMQELELNSDPLAAGMYLLEYQRGETKLFHRVIVK